MPIFVSQFDITGALGNIIRWHAPYTIPQN